MSLSIDIKRGKKVAKLLYYSFSTTGIFGNSEMPEDRLPKGVKKGSLDHIMFITLTVSIDYQREAQSLWESSRATYTDPDTKYLFSSKALHETPLRKIINDMQKHELSKKPIKDAETWRTVGSTFYEKWNGDPRNFLEDCRYDSPVILKRLKEDTHFYNNKKRPDFPYLRGNKIGPLWLRMLRDNIGIHNLKNLDKVLIPVDIHIARATLSLGIVRGSYEGSFNNNVFDPIKNAWLESVKGLNTGNQPMIALDIDEALWHLSKYGCSKHRDKVTGECVAFNRCEAKDYCIKGKVNLDSNYVELKT